MKPLTLVVQYVPGPLFEKAVSALGASDLVEALVVVGGEARQGMAGARLIPAESLLAGRTLGRLMENIRTPYLLLVPGVMPQSVEAGTLGRLVEVAASTGSGLVYPDYDEAGGGQTGSLHPLVDYQPGSVRDDFDFGAMMLFSVSAVRDAQKRHGAVPDVEFAGLYDLRLKVSIDHGVLHLPESLYTMPPASDDAAGGGRLFAYLDPRNEAVQREMEQVFTDYLKKIGAYVPGHRLRGFESPQTGFPVEASVIIPVRNRKGTVADAVQSALAQETDFPFNVIAVDNHSTDGTTEVLRAIASRTGALEHIIPERRDLAIGGCWNEALNSRRCGRYAVQLDSDDLYSGAHVLTRIVDKLRQGYAMVIGSYTLVDFTLVERPPGLIDHREWTDLNGHNNALRINGLGAPRAFSTALMREAGFLDVSYGEDYAASLRVCREYRIGRIYESLYLCRRWAGNTDAALDIEPANRNNAFKDRIRTDEIRARRRMMGEG
ncbi:MAG: glycosyltransferase family 2 protein [Syntrophorhabdales bacterium]|jgi:hypothetical protein